MSETAGAIIKLLAALTSPKACIKYITVAITLLFSWKYLEPVISETKISEEQLSIVLLLVGVGGGSLIGQVFSWFIELIWKKYQSKKEADINLKLKLEEEELIKTEEEKKQKQILEKIQNSFEHLHFEQKNTLRKLTLENETLDLLDSKNNALEKNGYVKRLVHVRDTYYLAQVNPCISDFVKSQWAAEKELKVKEFLQYNQYAEKLIELLEDKNVGKELFVDKEIVVGVSRYSQGVQGMSQDRESREGFWLWFESDLFEEFEKQTGKTFIDEVFVYLRSSADNDTTT